MLHARPDYAHIQDPTGKIPADEPVFLLRGCDIVAPFAVLLWSNIAETLGASPEIVLSAREHVGAMVRWQYARGAKVPDGPKPSAPVGTELGPLSDEEALIVRQIREHKAAGGGPSAILLD